MRSLKVINIFVVFSFFVSTHVRAQFRTSCITPNGERAQCISIRSCSTLFNALTTRNQQQLRFLRESQCGYGADPLVCCGSYNNYRNIDRLPADEPYNWGSTNRRTSTPGGNRNYYNERPTWGTSNREDEDDSLESNSNRRINSGGNRGQLGREPEDDRSTDRRSNSGSRSRLPSRSECGIQEIDRILNGQATDLREFPWMALLQYRKKSGNLVFSCGGSLISSRYVLTAAHCVKGQILTKIGPLINVRLGEYNTDTEEDCSNQLGFEICNDKPLDFSIDKVRAHSNYDEGSVNRYHDIALIKLKKEAPRTDFIKPICLPSRSEKSNVGDRLAVAGWGRTEYASSSPVKLKLWVPVVAASQCSSRFRTAGVALGSKQLCAGGERGKDSCSGDSGGPLMATTKNDSAQWYIEGIVSFGAKCGSEGWPGIYTRVGDYVDWINDNID